MRVQASSPDGLVTGELRGRSQVHLSFAPGSYRRYDEATLEQQLVGLARRLWAVRMKEYYAAVSEAFGETVTKESPAVGSRDVAFHKARDELVAAGRSTDGLVHIEVRGMRSWTMRIKDGTLRALPEEAFAVRVREAAAALIGDQFAKVRSLKLEIYQ
jgi:hypothetical protein